MDTGSCHVEVRCLLARLRPSNLRSHMRQALGKFDACRWRDLPLQCTDRPPHLPCLHCAVKIKKYLFILTVIHNFSKKYEINLS